MSSARLPPLFARIGLLLALAALALRLAIPAGWMPVADSSGLRMVICTGAGAVELPAGKSAPAQKPAADSPCAFAAVALLAIPVAQAVLAPAAAPVSAIAPLIAATIGQGLAAPPPPSTGPPNRL